MSASSQLPTPPFGARTLVNFTAVTSTSCAASRSPAPPSSTRRKAERKNLGLTVRKVEMKVVRPYFDVTLKTRFPRRRREGDEAPSANLQAPMKLQTPSS